MPDIQHGTMMYAPYLLGQAFIADLTRRMKPGASSEQWIGGLWDYAFQLVAAPDSANEVSEIFNAFYIWLGNHVEKVYGGEVVWDGMVMQLDLAYGRVRRRRSLIDQSQPVYNATRSTYSEDDITESDELMENGGWETPSTDTGHTFETFGDVAGDGTITQTNTNVRTGTYACLLVAGPNRDTKVGKTIHAQEETQYRLSFWARGNGSVAGRYEVWDVTAGASIVAVTSTGVTGTTYTQVNVDFTTPAGCTGVQIWFMCANTNGASTWFDDVSLLQYQPTQKVTAWFVNDASTARYGRIEHTYENPTYTEAEAENMAQMELAARAWPAPFVISISEQAQTPTLDVLACGYWLTAAWQESAVVLSAADDLSAVLNDLITTDCPFLTVGNIQANTFQVLNLDGETALKRIEGLVKLGDASLNHYRARVGVGRKFYYEQVDLSEPAYRLMPDGLRRSLAGPLLAPDQVRPGVVRDEVYPVDAADPNGVFANIKDMLVTDVVSRGGPPGALPELRTAELDDADLYAAQVAYQKEVGL